MANTRKPLIPPGTVASPAPSLMDSIINRDRTQGGRARPEPQTSAENDDARGKEASNTHGNTSSNIAGNIPIESSPSVARNDMSPSASPAIGRSSAVVGSRPKIAMTTITVRIPTELNEWIADYVHDRSAEGITKQDVIIAALRLLRSHEESV
jgi:hypothetical protein